ncbi:MAG: tripartite tricarboxylate transporter permease [Roseinatronobacter sp.]
MLDIFLGSVEQVFSPATLALLVTGTVVGIVAGAIPGFSIAMAIVLALPLTFAMEPLQGIAVMLSIYVGGYTGGLVSAALLGIPGTSASLATTFDAYPMARRGEAGRALSLGIWASFFGTLISTVVLIVAAPPLALVAVRLGPWEFFSLIVFALTIVASLVGNSMQRGLIAAIIGIVLGTIGADQMTGRTRFDMGIDLLAIGIPFAVALIGIFAISQLASDVEDAAAIKSGETLIKSDIKLDSWQVMKEVLSRPATLLRSSFIGVGLGALPGAGGSIANLIAYEQTKRASKTPENFGTGEPDGVVSSEAGNSATAGGGLIPLISLGIPGSPMDAILIAALMVHGISVGPRLIMDHPQLVYGMFIVMFVSSFLMLIICVLAIKPFLRAAEIPRWLIVPIVLTCCVVGTFALNNRVTDLYLLFFIGLLGYALKALDFPLAPMVLGVILGPIAEVNMRRALMIDNDWTLFLTRPLSALMLLLAVGSILWTVRRMLVAPKERLSS